MVFRETPPPLPSIAPTAPEPEKKVMKLLPAVAGESAHLDRESIGIGAREIFNDGDVLGDIAGRARFGVDDVEFGGGNGCADADRAVAGERVYEDVVVACAAAGPDEHAIGFRVQVNGAAVRAEIDMLAAVFQADAVADDVQLHRRRLSIDADVAGCLDGHARGVDAGAEDEVVIGHRGDDASIGVRADEELVGSAVRNDVQICAGRRLAP